MSRKTRTFKIMREPAARDYVFPPRPPIRPRRVAVVEAVSQKEALTEYLQTAYIATGHAQYAGHALEWRGEAINAAWHADDGDDKLRREWRLVVTLRNGASEHKVVLLAWRID